MTILDMLRDTDLLGGLRAFRNLASWWLSLVLLKAVYGLEMDSAELQAFRRFTGRTTPRAGGYPESVCIVGRQSGKSTIGAGIVDFGAIRCRDRGTYAVLVAQDQRAGLRAVGHYAFDPFETVPALRREVVRQTADTLELRTGCILACYPCRPEALRGIRAAVVVLDELAFYRSGENLPLDREMLRAVRPCLATTGGKLIILSSPYGATGALWDLYHAHYGRDESPVLVWQASAPEMNPILPKDYLQRMREDPEAARSEVDGEFRTGVSALFDPAALDACVVSGRRELCPQPGIDYRFFADPSGGRHDAFTLTGGHRAGEKAVLDVLRAWRPPFDPSVVVREAAALMKSYRAHIVTGDHYGGEWPRDAFRVHGIEYVVAAETKAQLYVALLPVVNSGAVELLDLPELLRECRALERRCSRSGQDHIDHPRGSGDDNANALAGLVALLPAQCVCMGPILVGGLRDVERERLSRLSPAGLIEGWEERSARNSMRGRSGLILP